MRIDMTLQVTPQMVGNAGEFEKKVFTGHLGTHFDVMNKEFPLEYVERKGIVFQISMNAEREIGVNDIDLSLIEKDMFVAFCTSFIENVGYGTQEYFAKHPYLSQELIVALVKKQISIIGVDFAGIRRAKEHRIADQYCADNNVFVVENLCNLKSILKGKETALFIAHTYPMNYSDMSGLPCRVVADIVTTVDKI